MRAPTIVSLIIVVMMVSVCIVGIELWRWTLGTPVLKDRHVSAPAQLFADLDALEIEVKRLRQRQGEWLEERRRLSEELLHIGDRVRIEMLWRRCGGQMVLPEMASMHRLVQ